MRAGVPHPSRSPAMARLEGGVWTSSPETPGSIPGAGRCQPPLVSAVATRAPPRRAQPYQHSFPTRSRMAHRNSQLRWRVTLRALGTVHGPAVTSLLVLSIPPLCLPRRRGLTGRQGGPVAAEWTRRRGRRRGLELQPLALSKPQERERESESESEGKGSTRETAPPSQSEK